MRAVLRMRRDFFNTLVADLERPHAFAAERVGFVYAKQANAGDESLMLFPVDYEAVRDQDYVEDESVGAAFNAAAIRVAMQRCRTTGLSCLQVHLHGHQGPTRFSGVDVRTIDALASSFRVVAPAAAHGGLVLSRDSASARVWLPGNRRVPARAVIVGFPMMLGPEVK